MTTEIHGFCEVRFQPLADAFRANFDAGLELGASLAVTFKGRMVLDQWAGWADRAGTRPWESDTIVNVFSTSKIMIAIAALLVVDRGLIDLDAPIARYWPDFAQGGKGEVTVRDAFTHQAGVPGFIPPVPFTALHDWDAITAHIAAQPHGFDGRKVVCYHQMTYGFVLGELIRRTDGRRPAQFFREEIAEPAGADVQFGLASNSELSRLAELRFPDIPAEGFTGIYAPGGPYAKIADSVAPGNWTSWERISADIPASVGLCNGRSIARICAIMAMGGELDGRRYLSNRMVQEAASEQVYAEDITVGWIKEGLGFGLDSPEFPAPSSTCIHWGGYGGSWGLADLKTGLSLGYAPNNLRVDPDQILETRLNRLFSALQILLPQL